MPLLVKIDREMLSWYFHEDYVHPKDNKTLTSVVHYIGHHIVPKLLEGKDEDYEWKVRLV